MTQYSPVCAPVAILCSRRISWDCPDVVGCYPYEFTLGDEYTVPASRVYQERMCPGPVSHSRVGLMTQDRESRKRLPATGSRWERVWLSKKGVGDGTGRDGKA